MWHVRICIEKVNNRHNFLLETNTVRAISIRTFFKLRYFDEYCDFGGTD
jgi:hypothetical protein